MGFVQMRLAKILQRFPKLFLFSVVDYEQKVESIHILKSLNLPSVWIPLAKNILIFIFFLSPVDFGSLPYGVMEWKTRPNQRDMGSFYKWTFHSPRQSLFRFTCSDPKCLLVIIKYFKVFQIPFWKWLPQTHSDVQSDVNHHIAGRERPGKRSSARGLIRKPSLLMRISVVSFIVLLATEFSSGQFAPYW